MPILFSRWAPDLYQFNAAVAGEASGVLPGKNAYLPWKSPVATSQALAAHCRGAVSVRKTDGTFAVFAGTATKLYKYVGPADAWTEVTRASGGDYNLPDDEWWSFAQFGDSLVAAQANDDIQVIDIGSGSNFAQLSADAPRARVVKTVGDHLFLGALVDNPTQIRWSALNNILGWTSGEGDSDYQDFPDGGWVNGLTALETGLIFQQGAIRRFIRDQGFIFAFQLVEAARGLLAPNSLVTYGNIAFYLSEDGFFATDGAGGSRPIGVDQVDNWFQANSEYDRNYAVIGAADPVRPRVYWLFPSTGNSTYLLDHIICYDIGLNQWSHAPVSASYLFTGSTPGLTLDGIDAAYPAYNLDTLPFSLDSRFLQGGAPYLACFNSDMKLAFFSGANLAATVETASFQAMPGRRAFVTGIRPLTDSTAISIQVGTSERPQTAVSYGAASTVNAQGLCPVRASGRVHRVKASIAAGEDWSHLQGIEVDAVQDGLR